MAGEHPSPEFLERFVDADLAPSERATLRAHLAVCAACAAQHAALLRLRELVKATVQADAEAQPVDFDSMFANIERGIAAANKPSRALRRTRWINRAAPALGAMALAAVAMLMVFRPDSNQQADTAGQPDDIVHRSEVVEVDFGTNAGTVFDIALSDGSSTPVVWIDDDDDDDE
jgi:anti-sigma factor RsiW